MKSIAGLSLAAVLALSLFFTGTAWAQQLAPGAQTPAAGQKAAPGAQNTARPRGNMGANMGNRRGAVRPGIQQNIQNQAQRHMELIESTDKGIQELNKTQKQIQKDAKKTGTWLRITAGLTGLCAVLLFLNMVFVMGQGAALKKIADKS